MMNIVVTFPEKWTSKGTTLKKMWRPETRLPLASLVEGKRFEKVRKLDLRLTGFVIVSARLTGTYCQHIFSLEKLVCSKSEFNLLYLFAKTNSLSFISLYHFLVKTIVFCMWPTCLRLSSPQLFIHKATFWQFNKTFPNIQILWASKHFLG